MRTDSELRSEFRSALEAVTPPAPWLGPTVKKGLGTKLATRRADQARVQLRFGLNVVAILILIGLLVAAVGAYMTLHQSVVPAHPGAGHVFFPTKMITRPPAGRGSGARSSGARRMREQIGQT